MSSPGLLAPLGMPMIQPLATQDWLQPGVTAVAALVAIAGVIVSTVIQRRTGRETAAAAKRSAEAAEESAASSDRASKAAEASVVVNERIGEAVGKRAEADVLSKRYQDSAEQLGHERAAVRLAGAYAMSRLADDWPEQRQSCVDVLCAYLRMPNHYERAPEAEGERQIRIAILGLIGDHLADAPVNWSDCKLDFSYAELPWIDWKAPVFNKQPDFNRARILGPMLMTRPRFARGISFVHTAFEGLVQIQHAEIASGDVALYGADVAGGVLTTDFLAAGSTINLSKSVCRGEFGVACSAASKEPQGGISLHEVVVKAGASLYLGGVDAEGGGDVSLNYVVSHPDAVVQVEPSGSVTLPSTFKEYPGRDIYNDVWKNS